VALINRLVKWRFAFRKRPLRSHLSRQKIPSGCKIDYQKTNSRDIGIAIERVDKMMRPRKIVTSKEDRVPSRSRRHVREGSIIGMRRTVTRNNPSDRALIKGRRERSEIADQPLPRVLLISATRAARFYMNENPAVVNHAINIINRIDIA